MVEQRAVPRSGTGRRAKRFLLASMLVLGLPAPALVAGPANAEATDKVKYYVVLASYLGNPERLPDIASRLLGSPGRSADIYWLNTGRVQPDGHRLTDPAQHLNAGWLLVLPWDAFGDGVILGLLPSEALAGPTNPPQPSPASTSTVGGGCAIKAQITSTATPWAQLRLAPNQAWAVSRGAGVTVALVDSGVNATAPALSGRLLAEIDLTSNVGPGVDCAGHGTAMAGIVAAQPRPESRLIGIAPEAKILPIKVNLDQGRLKATDAASAISVSVSAGASVVMMPGAVDLADDAVRQAIDDAVGRDVVVVVAGDTVGRVTARRPGVLRVGAIGADDRLVARYAPGGIDVLAPGDGVVSLAADGSGEIVGSGSDFAVPFVAGLVALVRAAAPDLSATSVTKQIEDRADRTGETPDPAHGFGVINPGAAVISPDHVPGRESAQLGHDDHSRRVITTAILAAFAATVLAFIFLPRRKRARHADGSRHRASNQLIS